MKIRVKKKMGSDLEMRNDLIHEKRWGQALKAEKILNVLWQFGL